MLAPYSRRLTRVVQRFGIDYECRDYGHGVVSYIPADRPGAVPEFLEDMTEHVLAQGFLEPEDPLLWGFQVRNIYHPHWPKSGMAHIFQHPARQEFLKIPVVMRSSHIQFFAMNALNRALEGSDGFNAVAGNAMIRHRWTGHTCLFFAAAEGVKAADHMTSLWRDKVAREQYKEVEMQIKDRTKELIFCLPRSLRPLCNDNPAFHPALSGNQGLDNVFLDADMTDDPRTANLTMIDQAHPTISQRVYNLVASKL